MRKFLIGLALLSISAAPMAVLAVGGPQECCKLRRTINLDGTDVQKGTVVGENSGICVIGGQDVQITSNPNWGALCLINTFNGIIDWMFTIFIVLAVFFTILGAFNILTAGGDATKVTAGRTHILYAAIGLAVAFIARAIPGLVKGIMGF